MDEKRPIDLTKVSPEYVEALIRHIKQTCILYHYQEQYLRGMLLGGPNFFMFPPRTGRARLSRLAYEAVQSYPHLLPRITFRAVIK